jgi:hypothetical protein
MSSLLRSSSSSLLSWIPDVRFAAGHVCGCGARDVQACDVARQVTPPVNQHARFPLGDWNVTEAANRSLTRTTARGSGALDAAAAVEALAPADSDGDGAAVDDEAPDVQPASTPTLSSTTAATRRPRVPERPTRNRAAARLHCTDVIAFPLKAAGARPSR